jgi:hypothetical protein
MTKKRTTIRGSGRGGTLELEFPVFNDISLCITGEVQIYVSPLKVKNCKGIHLETVVGEDVEEEVALDDLKVPLALLCQEPANHTLLVLVVRILCSTICEG